MKASIAIAAVLTLAVPFAANAADLVFSGDVPAESHQFVHPQDEVGFNPQPEPPAKLRINDDQGTAMALLLPAIQKVREAAPEGK